MLKRKSMRKRKREREREREKKHRHTYIHTDRQTNSPPNTQEGKPSKDKG